jgi:hypothetical protein
MDEITRGGAMFKHTWATLPKDRKRAISKAVQSGRAVTEETAIAIGYAVRQIRLSWTGYVGVLVLAVVINDVQGESFSGRALLIPIAVALVGLYSYWRLFQSRSKNEDLLFAQEEELDDAGDADDGEEEEGTDSVDLDAVSVEAIERLEDEGGPVSEVAVPPLAHPPTPPQPQIPTPQAPAPEAPAPETSAPEAPAPETSAPEAPVPSEPDAPAEPLIPPWRVPPPADEARTED